MYFKGLLTGKGRIGTAPFLDRRVEIVLKLMFAANIFVLFLNESFGFKAIISK